MPKSPPSRTPADLARAYYRARDNEAAGPARLAELQRQFSALFPAYPVPGRPAVADAREATR